MLIKDENFNIENNNNKKRKKYYNYEAKTSQIEDGYITDKIEPNFFLEDTFIRKWKKIYILPILINDKKIFFQRKRDKQILYYNLFDDNLIFKDVNRSFLNDDESDDDDGEESSEEKIQMAIQFLSEELEESIKELEKNLFNDNENSLLMKKMKYKNKNKNKN